MKTSSSLALRETVPVLRTQSRGQIGTNLLHPGTKGTSSDTGLRIGKAPGEQEVGRSRDGKCSKWRKQQGERSVCHEWSARRESERGDPEEVAKAST